MISVHPEVEAALRDDRPVVALETAVVTHGVPRRPPGELPFDLGTGWEGDRPVNLQLIQRLDRLVRDEGATPAVLGVFDGGIRIGLNDDELQRLALTESPAKASTRDLAAAIADGAAAGVTVAGAIHVCALASPRPIRVFATGGIGGVHRGWQVRPDISADLDELARSPVCVVCAGVKSILDVEATVEALDSGSVPVIGFQTDCFPRFVCPGDDRLRVPHRFDDASSIAAVCRTHWEVVRATSAVLVVQEAPRSEALPIEVFEEATAQAERDAVSAGVAGAERTPFLLERVTELTAGRSLRANLALLELNARTAAQVAGALARGSQSVSPA